MRLYDYGSGLSPAEIARQTGVSYSSVYGLTRARQRVNPETGRSFESLNQYRDYTARQRVNPETGRSFESLSQYYDHTARRRVNPETGRSFESLSQYRDYTTRQRVNRSENQGLSDLIRRKLKELGKNQSWLAEEIGVTRQTVSLYVKGKTVPKDDLLQKLYSSLDVPYGTLDDLLE
ncbi:MAG: helix-turn-helix transcriptional regulator [Candidatus Woesearchaeota archaeon]|nr:helix-turn-helix transcriptional regulator [Candidatus Woesearchaeota archaeon]